MTINYYYPKKGMIGKSNGKTWRNLLRKKKN